MPKTTEERLQALRSAVCGAQADFTSETVFTLMVQASNTMQQGNSVSWAHVREMLKHLFPIETTQVRVVFPEGYDAHTFYQSLKQRDSWPGLVDEACLIEHAIRFDDQSLTITFEAKPEEPAQSTFEDEAFGNIAFMVKTMASTYGVTEDDVVDIIKVYVRER